MARASDDCESRMAAREISPWTNRPLLLGFLWSCTTCAAMLEAKVTTAEMYWTAAA